MNVNESINRVKELMGIIVESKHSNTIKKMIDSVGLYDTIQMVGSYSTILNFIDSEDITDNNKIKFIQEVIKIKSPENNVINSDFSNFEPISYNESDDVRISIMSLSRYGVIANVFKNGKYYTTHTIPYDRMSEEVLNKIFKWMLKFSQNN
jgi:hypothetical protein